MPPKCNFTKQEIIDAAFEIARKEGIHKISARKIAEKLKSSTSPIYSYFQDMGTIEDEVCKMCSEILLKYQTTVRTGTTFIDLALGYILFARDENALFRYMFMNRDALRDFSHTMIENNRAILTEKMKSDPLFSGLSCEQTGELWRIGWIFVHGIATQMSIGALHFQNDEEIVSLLKKVMIPIITKMSEETIVKHII